VLTDAQTIQSISLLAFLAEHHNLWGPFLVIAPSSTLHNWQQELARFVPRLKALPYWGSPKDRETLRRIWCRKNMTFNEQSPFHILVTSYQLVRRIWSLSVVSSQIGAKADGSLRPCKMRSTSTL
jgi:SNF2 family DNA or RNA helicase